MGLFEEGCNLKNEATAKKGTVHGYSIQFEQFYTKLIQNNCRVYFIEMVEKEHRI